MENTENLLQAANEVCTLSSLPQMQGATYHQLLDVLSHHINYLVQNNVAGLIQLLYTMDIAEDKLRRILKENRQELASTYIAQLMIERQLQKIKARQAFTPFNNIPDDEKW